MTSKEIKEKFIRFFEKKEHKIVPSSLLVPQDKTVLLVSAGMQQFIPYLSGTKDIINSFGSRHLASIQKCFRTPDIEEVGDDTHYTFFEMLGNWSIGEDLRKGYFKEGAIEMAMEFFTKDLGLNKENLWITIFKGELGIPKDTESFAIWQKHGISKERILEFGLDDNFWGPTAQTGPCGPCSEIYYDRGKAYGCGLKKCAPNCSQCKRFVELWNLVFMEYNKNKDNTFSKLPHRNVDTGIGMERLTALLQNKDSAYETDLFRPILEKLEKISNKEYEKHKKAFRIIADHIRGSAFLISDGVVPKNTEEGYILRRILRRAIRYGKIIGLSEGFLSPLAEEVVNIYQADYPSLFKHKKEIFDIIQKEEQRFSKTLEKGLKELAKIEDKTFRDGERLFYIFETYGFPLELSLEELRNRVVLCEAEIREKFNQALRKHQEISRAGAEKKFAGIGEENSKEAIKLHTATHLLHQSLRMVLGSHVKQMGSDITVQRLRFDFTHPNKLTDEEIKKVEELVNQVIKKDLEVIKTEMSLEKALATGALSFFKEKYPETVTVFLVGKEVFSSEICGGPHVRKTGELSSFKIIKEESSGAGIRRIKAIVK